MQGESVPEDPVHDVQRAVGTKSKDIVRRNCFSFAKALEKEHLRQDRDSFQKDAVRPVSYTHLTLPTKA